MLHDGAYRIWEYNIRYITYGWTFFNLDIYCGLAIQNVKIQSTKGYVTSDSIPRYLSINGDEPPL